MKSPAFQFYPNDWLGSQRVSLLSLEEEGAYIRLLAYCWRHGSIPADPEKLARLIGKGASTTLATVVQAMFQPSPNDPSTLVHDRLESEREKQDAWSEKSRIGGKKSAEVRNKSKGGSTTAQRVVEECLPNGSNQMATLQSSSSSSLSTPIVPKGDGELKLEGEAPPKPRITSEEIYQAYPLKVAKPAALRAIEKAMKIYDPEKLLMLTKKFAVIRGGEKAFTKNPATWFNNHCFNDEPDTWKPRAQSVPTTPIHIQIETIEKSIRCHPANRESAAHDPSCPQEKRDQLKALRAQLAALKGIQS